MEDTGIAIGLALSQALGERRGIARYASMDLAMDETLTRAALDVSGRPFLVWHVEFPSQKIGTFDTELCREFFQALSHNAGITLHVTNHYGANSHSYRRDLLQVCGPGPAQRGRDRSAAGRRHSVDQGNAGIGPWPALSF